MTLCLILGGSLMINLIKKDFILIFSNKMKLYTLLFAIPIIMVLISYFSVGLAHYLGFIAIIFISTSADEGVEGKSSVLLASLPINKNHIVISQFLSTYIIFILSSIYTILVLFILGKLGLHSILDYYNTDLIRFLIGLSIILISVNVPIKLFSNRNSNSSLSSVSFINIIFISRYFKMLGEASEPFELSSAGTIILAIIVAASFMLSIAGSLLAYKDKEYY